MIRFTAMTAGLFCLMGLAGPAMAADIHVTIHNVNEEGGNIRVAVCDKDNWLTYHCPYKLIVETKPGDVETTFRNIPAGSWAVIAVHDANLNEKLDENFLGIPTEQFGFSNNPGFNHEPKFSEATVAVDKDPVDLSIDFEK